ncbi:MAG TPA: glycerate kinase, partial [Pricia sp.]|nr:glycerate kinase [Pricia sp.]
MRVLVAPDSFKECLSSKEVATAISKGIKNAIPDAEVFEVPISDGGEGVLEAVMQGAEMELVSVTVMDPLLRPIASTYGILKNTNTAVVEMAKASGLELLTEQEKNPLLTSTYGTGQLIKHALDSGCRKIVIGIGGSATNDGGAGMVRALGGKFLDVEGNELKDGGGNLGNLAHIDLLNFDSRIDECEIQVACDVSNPLTGKNGASFIYGKQKGGSITDLEVLDENLSHYASIIKKDLGVDVLTIPGTGAAGGTGAGLLAFMNAALVNGIELILKTIGIETYLKKVDLVITGEGKIDEQTLNGKSILGIATMAKLHYVPVIVLTGKIGDKIE